MAFLTCPTLRGAGGASTRYGWDSAQCAGLLRDGRRLQARQMVDNFIYQIEYYGYILNANSPIT